MDFQEIEIGREEDNLIMSLSPSKTQVLLRKGDYFIPTYALVHGDVEMRKQLGDVNPYTRFITKWKDEGMSSFTRKVVEAFVDKGPNWIHKPIFSIYSVGSNSLTNYYSKELQFGLELEIYRSNSSNIIRIPYSDYWGDATVDFDIQVGDCDNYFELRDFVSSNVRAMQKRVASFQIA